MNWCEACYRYVPVSGTRQDANGDDIFDCGHSHANNRRLREEKDVEEATTTTLSKEKQDEIAARIKESQERAKARRIEIDARLEDLKKAAAPLESTRYFHFRRECVHGNIMARGGVTVAVRQGDVGSYEIVAAVCSLDDQYCKRVGRAMANEQLGNDDADVFRIQVPVGGVFKPEKKHCQKLERRFVEEMAMRLAQFTVLSRWAGRGFDFADDLKRAMMSQRMRRLQRA
jgi:hypothetical protein